METDPATATAQAPTGTTRRSSHVVQLDMTAHLARVHALRIDDMNKRATVLNEFNAAVAERDEEMGKISERLHAEMYEAQVFEQGQMERIEHPARAFVDCGDDCDDGRRFVYDDKIGVCTGGGYARRPPFPTHADYVRIQHHKKDADFEEWFVREYPALKILRDEYKTLLAAAHTRWSVDPAKMSPELYKRRVLIQSILRDDEVRFVERGTQLHLAYCGDDGYSIQTMEDVEWISA